jgi:predicted TIM-barrel fold metal-dependent hydrolase
MWRTGGRAPIIDAHVHLGPGDGLRHPADTAGSVDRYLELAGPAGIDAAVVMAPLNEDYGPANRFVARLVRQRPDRFIGFCFVHPVNDRGRIAQLAGRAVTRWGFRGIKVHARNGTVTREIGAAARRLGVPVLYDPMGDTASVEMAAAAYPEVAWIVPHLGSFADDWRAQRAFVDQLTRLPNLFADTSGVRYFDLLQEAATRAGPSRIVFGSDGPFLHPGVELVKARLLGFDAVGTAAVLGGNIMRLTQLDRTLRRAG